MEKVLSILKRNLLPVAVGVLFYAVYLHFTYEGNRICDCETTEKYSPSTSTSSSRHGYVGVHRFYHK